MNITFVEFFQWKKASVSCTLRCEWEDSLPRVGKILPLRDVGLRSGHQVLIHPLQDLLAHFRQFHMGTIKQLDVAVRFLAVLAIERKKVIANLLHASGWS